VAQKDVVPIPIAFVSSHARNGGAERYLATLLGQLGPDWVRTVICLEEGPLVARLRAAGHPVEVVRTSGRWTSLLRSAWRLRRLIRRARPGLVHANGIKAALVCGLACVRPIVWVKHDFSWDGRLANLVASRCRMVVGVSEAVTRTIQRRERVRVVPTGIAEPASGPGVRPEALDPGVPLAAVFGYLHPVKGQAELVEAVPAVLEHVPEARFLVVGDDDPSAGGYGASVRARAQELGLSDAVRFLGHREDAIELMRACDLVVVPTVARGEGFGLVGLEALAVGTPVVGYRAGALPEVVGDCGTLVPPGDRAALAEAIVRLLEDEALRSELARRGRERARERFSLARWSEAMAESYREAS
jgi:glycosyltransferase involved in cell wall biosynthesis